MNVTVQVVRVYGCSDYYGSAPHTALSGSPITLPELPAKGDRMVVHLGSIPETILRAYQVTRAYIRCILEGSLARNGDPPNKVDALIRAHLAEMPWLLRKTTANWHITALVERNVDVEESYITDNQFIWLDLETAFRLEKESLSYAADHIDRLAVGVSLSLGHAVIEDIVLMDRVFFLSPDREPFGLPQFHVGSATLAIQHRATGLEVVELTKALQSLMPIAERRHRELGRVLRWYLDSAQQRDRWKQFLWSFLGLEMLTHRLFSEVYEALVADIDLASHDSAQRGSRAVALSMIVPQRTRVPLKSRFAMVALALFPAEASSDASTFASILDARNALAHGDIVDPAQLPARKTQELLRKYLAKALLQDGG